MKSQGLTLIVKAGRANINGAFYWQKDDETITLEQNTATKSYNIILRLNDNDAYRNITLVASDINDGITRSDSIYDLVLATVTVTGNASEIKGSDITDTRLDSTRCGAVTSAIKSVQSLDLFTQVTELFKEIKAQNESEMNANRTEFNDWFETVKDTLDKNTAGKLSNRISNIENMIMENHFTTILLTEDGTLVDENGHDILADWAYEIDGGEKGDKCYNGESGYITENLANQVEQNAISAQTSATNAKASETKAKEYANNLQNSTEAISQLKEDIDTIENTGFNVRKSRNIMNPSGITENSWLLTDGTIQTPSPYGNNTTVYSGSIVGGRKLFMTYQNDKQRNIFEVSRYVFENSSGAIASGGNILMNGIDIPIGATKIKILFNTASLKTKLQMEYDSVSDYLEYGSKFLTHKKTDIEVNSTFFSPRYLYVYSGTMRYIDKMNVVASISDNLMNIESTQNDPSIGIKDKICAIYGVDKIELKSKITGDILFSKPIGLNKVDVSTKTNPNDVVNIMMIGDSYTANNILPCDIKKQLVNEHNFTNYNFVGGITGADNGVTCKHEGRVGYSIGDYLKVNNENAGGNKFPNPYLFNGKVSIKEYCDNKSIQYPNVFIVELGINDIEKGYISDGVYGSLNKRIKQFIDLIHSEFTNAKILIVGVIYASVDNGQASYVSKNKNRMEYNQTLENIALSESYMQFTKYCDVGALFDTVNGYSWNEKIAYRGSEQKIKEIADWLHPSRAGYYMESDCIVPALLDFNIR